MKIEKHWLVRESQSEKIIKDPTTNYQYQILPKYLIIHYTAGDKADGAVSWFKNTPQEGNPDKICAHIVIDTDGTITQLAPFNTKCNHAGYSYWDGRTGINEHSIGIEIVNQGYCEKLQNGSYRRKVGVNKDKTIVYKQYPATEQNRIVKLKHKHKFLDDPQSQYWFKFTPEQITAVTKLSKLLFQEYQLIFVVGHDDISVARKPDPGPAFPWDEFKERVFEKIDNTGKIFLINSPDGFANFRINPDKNSTALKKLNNGYEVGLIETFGQWSKVYLANDIKEVIKKVDGKSHCIKTEGWIHSSLIKTKQ